MVTEEEKQQAQSIGLEPEVVFNTLSDRRILAVQQINNINYKNYE